MKRTVCMVFAAVCASTLIACSAQKQNTQTPKANLTFEETNLQVKMNKSAVTDYKLHETAPVMLNGRTVALLTLNQVQKLGIYDWTSAEVVDSGIKTSYTCNFKLQYLGKIDNGKMITFYIKPILVNKSGKVVGKPCIVGWSGFAETAVFDHKTNEVYFEYGVQPLKRSLKGCKLVLKVSDSDGNEYDDVEYAYSTIKKSRKGPSIHVSDKPVTVTGASGAKYKININKVYLENCFDDYYTFENETQVQNATKVPTLMFNYRVDYVSEPTKKLEVNNISTSRTATTLSTDLKIGAQSNVDKKIYYERNLNLTRMRFSNSFVLEHSTIKKRLNIHKGTYAYYSENRQVDDVFLNSTSTIRFRVELNSDAIAMKPKELMKFNGRFIVFERQPEFRKVYKIKTQKCPFIAYTSDTNYKNKN